MNQNSFPPEPTKLVTIVAHVQVEVSALDDDAPETAYRELLALLDRHGYQDGVTSWIARTSIKTEG